MFRRFIKFYQVDLFGMIEWLRRSYQALNIHLDGVWTGIVELSYQALNEYSVRARGGMVETVNIWYFASSSIMTQKPLPFYAESSKNKRKFTPDTKFVNLLICVNLY